MTWSTKPLIPQNGDDEKILTPDYHDILVGSPEDEVLLYQRAFTNWGLETKLSVGVWGLKGKTTGIWGLKTKTTL